jgi:hypothetical protein
MNLRGLLKFVSGNLERRTLLFILVPLIFLAYFGTLILACFGFSGTYDWRYRVISSLISPWNNPALHWIPSAGIAGTGLLMIPFAGTSKGECVLLPGLVRISGLSHLEAESSG